MNSADNTSVLQSFTQGQGPSNFWCCPTREEPGGAPGAERDTARTTRANGPKGCPVLCVDMVSNKTGSWQWEMLLLREWVGIGCLVVSEQLHSASLVLSILFVAGF